MSLENEDRRSSDKSSQNLDVLLKKNISYSRDFLLSLSNLDICKKLPSGFDESLLSEIADASQSIPDRPRIPGTLPLHGLRRNEYGSSPPPRGDSNNYFKGIYGKWESHSSGRGRSDQASDSQSDRDSDSGRCYGSQSRRSWQTPEHDGLLGSGSFPRPSAHAGVTAPKVQTNEKYQLSKSNEPYHPPRPYKALPHLRKDTDFFNDETFGSSECTSRDKSEEEMRRRASFEVMRKEQLKVLQEKQKIMKKQKAAGASNLSEVLGDGKEEKGIFGNMELDVSAATSISSNHLEKSSFASNSPVMRPLIPPGFRNNVLEKGSGLKSLTNPPLSEVEKPETGDSLLDTEVKTPNSTSKHDGVEQSLSQEISLVDGQPSEKIQNANLLKNEENVNSDACLHVPIRKFCIEDQLHCTPTFSEFHETLNDPEVFELDGEILEEKTFSDSKESHSTSIVENIFGSTTLVNGRGSSSAENGSKPNKTWSPSSVQPLKFAQWFSEEDARAPDDSSQGKPNDLLSLIVCGDKPGCHAFDAEASGQFPLDFSYKSLEQSYNIASEISSATTGVFDQVSDNDKEEALPALLTCVDLEQSILSEYSGKTKIVQPLLECSSSAGANIEKPRSRVDSNASIHLLSLLQKGTDETKTTTDFGVDINLVDNTLLISQEHDTGTAVYGSKGKEKSKNIPNPGNTLTFESLFSNAFMQELQSAESPISVQRCSNDSARVDNNISFPVIDITGLRRPSWDSSRLVSDLRESKAENWLAFEDSRADTTSPKRHTDSVPKRSGFEGVREFRLPEQENLIPVGDPWDHQMLTFRPIGNSSSGVNFSSSAPIDITRQLATRGADVKNEQVMPSSESGAFKRAPYNEMELEIPYHNLQVQQSPPFQPPSYHQLESRPAHLNSQMKFLGQDLMFNHDSPANRQLSPNIARHPFHHLNGGAADYDPSHHLMQMKMPGIHTPYMTPNYKPVFHHGNQGTGLVQQMSQMQGFSFGEPPPRAGSYGIPISGPNINSGGTPETFQRLIEMELCANSKQIHPLGHNPGIYGHEVKHGFQLR